MTSVSFAKEKLYPASWRKLRGSMWLRLSFPFFPLTFTRYSMSVVWKCRFFTPKSFNSWLYESPSDPLTRRKHHIKFDGHFRRKFAPIDDGSFPTVSLGLHDRLPVQKWRRRMISPKHSQMKRWEHFRLSVDLVTKIKRERERERDKRFIVSLERQLIAIGNWNRKPFKVGGGAEVALEEAGEEEEKDLERERGREDANAFGGFSCLATPCSRSWMMVRWLQYFEWIWRWKRISGPHVYLRRTRSVYLTPVKERKEERKRER